MHCVIYSTNTNVSHIENLKRRYIKKYGSFVWGRFCLISLEKYIKNYKSHDSL
jgi:hypothetical protein